MGEEDPPAVGTGQEGFRQGAVRRWRTVELVIDGLPGNLSTLDRAQLQAASERRDARMTILFRSWSSLSKAEMRELRHLSDERVRLAKHVGILRGLHRLRAPSTTT